MKIKWRNLLIDKCPHCNKDLLPPTNWRIILCENPVCDFAITVSKFNTIRNSMMVKVKGEGYPQLAIY